MIKGRMTRVGELRKFLEGFSDDSLVYHIQNEYSTRIIVESNTEGDTSLNIGEIYSMPMTNRTPREEIIRFENFFG